jgi:hypothetical protein
VPLVGEQIYQFLNQFTNITEYNLDPISRSNKFPVLRAFGWRADLSISKPIYEYN